MNKAHEGSISQNDYLDYLKDMIQASGDRIYVRAKVEGQWESVAISKLPIGEAIPHIFQWIKDGRYPVMCKGEAELNHSEDNSASTN